jgi:VIT1/CCC1 family predicted Fe2+/Mn2+ transporter
MPATPHVEQHFTASETVRDVVIGMSDGLTVPFALAAGLSSAVQATAVVVTAGLAEIAAGSIAMGLGGYLAAQTDIEHYHSERRREEQETVEMPEAETDEVAVIFREYGLTDEQSAPVVAAIRADRARWVDFMMRFELGLEAPDPARARQSALTIALSYIVGGLVPLSPYILLHNLTTALYVSVAVTLIALFVFGYVKATFTGINPLRGGVQTTLTGGIAAATAFAIARLIG